MKRLDAWMLKHGAPAIRWALAVMGLAAIVSLLSALAGCAGSPYARHARGATITAASLATTGAAVDAARDVALDAVEAEHPMHGPERTAALETEAAEWRPVGAALDAARSALLTWVQAIEMARAAEAGSDLLPQLGAIAGRVALLYDEIARLLDALDVDAPGLPATVRALAGALGGGR